MLMEDLSNFSSAVWMYSIAGGWTLLQTSDVRLFCYPTPGKLSRMIFLNAVLDSMVLSASWAVYPFLHTFVTHSLAAPSGRALATPL